MKAYGIFPRSNLAAYPADVHEHCISLVAEIVCERLRRGGDYFHYAIDWRDPGGAAWGVFTDDVAEPHVVELSDPDELMRLVRLSLDPFSEASANIRSIATCRAVTFGYDGQAFLCLRHDDEAPISPDSSLVVIEERPDLLVEADYFDGWVRGR